ncbi:MAG: hypothetical protein HN909_04360, partial [Phycisphaerales bacterium]|nr:hypothetical protein [Phycisphaerales bacterium]
MRTTLLTTLLLAGVLSAATISPTPPKQTNKKKAKLYQAGMKALKTNCPTTAAKAAKGRKILVVNLCAGFPHSSIPLVAQAIEAMGKSTGAYEADFTNDMTAFDDAVLKGYDAVVLNNTTKLPVSASQKKALMDFVKSGKGLVGIHAAADNFYDWPEGAAMVGGLFDGHPWRYNMSSKFKVEGKSPLTAMFPQGGFRYTEEIYQLKAPYSRKALRIVLSLDMSDKKTAAVKGKKRTDNDYAIAFCQKIGKGRSFYTGIGHNETVVSDAAVLKHYLAGIQYAIGDLAVDDSPSGELKAAPVAAPVAVKIGTGAFAELLDYTYAKGQTKTATMLQDIVRTTPAAQYPALEARLLATYSSPKATVDCKTVCLETLRPVASCATTRVIGPGLVDAKLSDSVRAVLEGITCPRANPALRDALGKTDNDTIKAGLISTLAARGDTDAASLIAASLTSKNATLRMVAIKAIGRIGNPDCAPVLQGLKFTGPEATASNIAIAQCLVTTPKNLARFVAGLTDPATKAVALGILARADTSLAIIPLLDALDANDKILAKAANSILNSIRGDAFTKAVASAMPGAPAAKQAKLITILSGRPGPMAAKGIRAAATSKDPVVQQAVATALGAMGSAADLPAVLSLIASANADVAAAAKAALGTMPGDDVNAALIAYLAKCSGDDKLLPLNALAERKAPEAYPVFLAHAADLEDRKAFAVSIRALADYGTIAQIEPLTKLYLATPASGYTKAITAIATRSTDVEARSAA